ncbi:MAG: GNAT family N-acetyltransferase, partial [Rikenellaceae bacterium]|nr:GNAT family N-acetyltransferase [Rikenellaceae bacterium]
GGEPRAALHYDTQSGKNVLAHIVVEPELRGQGIARQLVAEFVRVCRNVNSRYSLWVRQDNSSAQNLYKKMGFRSTNKYSFSMLKL